MHSFIPSLRQISRWLLLFPNTSLRLPYRLLSHFQFVLALQSLKVIVATAPAKLFSTQEPLPNLSFQKLVHCAKTNINSQHNTTAAVRFQFKPARNVPMENSSSILYENLYHNTCTLFQVYRQEANSMVTIQNCHLFRNYPQDTLNFQFQSLCTTC